MTTNPVAANNDHSSVLWIRPDVVAIRPTVTPMSLGPSSFCGGPAPPGRHHQAAQSGVSNASNTELARPLPDRARRGLIRRPTSAIYCVIRCIWRQEAQHHQRLIADNPYGVPLLKAGARVKN